MIIIPILIVVVFLAITITNSRIKKNSKQSFEVETNQTQYNPATGLPNGWKFRQLWKLYWNDHLIEIIIGIMIFIVVQRIIAADMIPLTSLFAILFLFKLRFCYGFN